MNRIITSLVFCVLAQTVSAQLPRTNVYLFGFLNQEVLKITDAKYLTEFNDYGYNNQPSFLDDNTVLLTSNHYDKTQTDIIRLDIDDKTMKRLTKTPESEFSPLYNSMKKSMSTIRVESDESQKIHIYKTNGYNQGYKVLDDVSNIGYHLWDKKGDLYLYIIEGTDSKLMHAKMKSNQLIPVLDNVGRCLKLGPDGKIYFVHKVSAENWYVKSYDPETKKVENIVRSLKGKEDFELINGAIIAGSGGFIYQHILGPNNDWKKMGDLSKYGIRNITRLEVRKNQLLVVDKGRF